LQPHILPTEDLTGIYRFTVLLTGSPQAAQAAMLEVFADGAEKIHHFRSGKSCEAWLVAKVRTRLLNKPLQPAAAPENPGPAPSAAGETDTAALATLELAARFSRLPEPGRSALALLYIDCFSVQEIAQILQLPLEMMAEAVDSARCALRGMETVRQAAASAEGTPL
jgi:DNA-directed RNA polymerase specialized sigma24 family protein